MYPEQEQHIYTVYRDLIAKYYTKYPTVKKEHLDSNSTTYSVIKVSDKDLIPYHLLLLADETMDAIGKYIHSSEVYMATIAAGDDPVGVFALHENSSEEIEIKNIAVAENNQGKGVGSFLIESIVRIAKGKDYNSIIVGTPDTAHLQIRFYERNGFVAYDTKKNFFINNYPEPIIEDGVQLRDMLMMRRVIR